MTFHRFMDLPPELRNRVYQELLPDRVTLCKKGEGNPLVSTIPLLLVSRQVRREVKDFVFLYTEFDVVLIHEVLTIRPIVPIRTPERRSLPNTMTIPQSGPSPLLGTMNKGHLFPFSSDQQATALFARVKKLGVTLNLNTTFDNETVLLLHDRFVHFHKVVQGLSFQSFHLRINIDASTRSAWAGALLKNPRSIFRPPLEGVATLPVGRPLNWEYTTTIKGLNHSESAPEGIFIHHERLTPKRPPCLPRRSMSISVTSTYREPDFIYNTWLAFRALFEYIEPLLREHSQLQLHLMLNDACGARIFGKYDILMRTVQQAIELWNREPSYKRIAGRGTRLVKIEPDKVEEAAKLVEELTRMRDDCLKNRGEWPDSGDDAATT